MGSGNIFCAKEKKATSTTILKGAVKVTKSYQRMGYTALNVGPYDLAAHEEKLRGKIDQSMFVSLNLLDNKGDFLFTPYKIVRVGTKDIAIIGLTGTTPISSPYASSSWRDALNKNLVKIKKESDFIILLSSLTTAENRRIAQDFTDIEVIVNADPKINNLSPSIINKTVLTQTKTLGQYLGVLDLSIDKKSAWKENYYHINNLKVKKQVLAQQIKTEKNKKNRAQLQAELATIPTQIETLTKNLATQQGVGFAVEFVPVTALLNKHPSIEAIMNK